MRIILCGDSYYDFDDRYPNLHWADKLKEHEVYRLARGGSSNFSIWHQIQHTVHFNPDVVLISFTAPARIEFSKRTYTEFDLSAADSYTNKQWIYRNTMHDNIDHANAGYNKEKYVRWIPYWIEEFDIMKNTLYIKAGLDFLTERNIPFYFSYGGFSAYSKNFGQKYSSLEQLPNSWEYQTPTQSPYFHINDDAWHQHYANCIRDLING